MSHMHKYAEMNQIRICFVQVAGGTHFVQSSLEAFRVPSVKNTILVDMFGYDACPAFTAMED